MEPCMLYKVASVIINLTLLHNCSCGSFPEFGSWNAFQQLGIVHLHVTATPQCYRSGLLFVLLAETSYR